VTGKLEEKIEAQEEEFFGFLSHSVQIDRMGSMPDVIDAVRNRLDTDLPIHVFLYEFPCASAMCMPRFALGNQEDPDELIVLVSQHFVNDLSDNERAFILGHEIGHIMLDHVRVPRKALLDHEVDTSKIPELRSDILRWAICCEISCDVLGFLASGRDYEACSLALLKYTTGLTANVFQHWESGKLIEQSLAQYERLSESVVESVISTHPLTPLRLKILERLPEEPFLRAVGDSLPIEAFTQQRESLNTSIDTLVRRIYPELFDEEALDQGFIVFYLGVATALADGNMDREEVRAIRRIVGDHVDTESFFADLEQTLQTTDHRTVVDELVKRAVMEAQSKEFTKKDAIRCAREMLIVAAADGKVDSNELMTIYHFGKAFELTKQELIYLANQATTMRD